MGRGAAGNREPGGGRRRGAGPGREALPARASRPRPRRPCPAQPRRAARGRGGGGSTADTPSRPAPTAPRPAAPRPPPLPRAPLPRPAPGPRSAVGGRAAPRPLGPARSAPAVEAASPSAASASAARSSRSFPPPGRSAWLARAFLFPSPLSPCLSLSHPAPTPSALARSLSASAAPSLWLSLLSPCLIFRLPSVFFCPGLALLSGAPSTVSPLAPLSLPIPLTPTFLRLCLRASRPQPSLSLPIWQAQSLPSHSLSQDTGQALDARASRAGGSTPLDRLSCPQTPSPTERFYKWRGQRDGFKGQT